MTLAGGLFATNEFIGYFGTGALSPRSSGTNTVSTA